MCHTLTFLRVDKDLLDDSIIVAVIVTSRFKMSIPFYLYCLLNKIFVFKFPFHVYVRVQEW